MCRCSATGPSVSSTAARSEAPSKGASPPRVRSSAPNHGHPIVFLGHLLCGPGVPGYRIQVFQVEIWRSIGDPSVNSSGRHPASMPVFSRRYRFRTELPNSRVGRPFVEVRLHLGNKFDRCVPGGGFFLFALCALPLCILLLAFLPRCILLRGARRRQRAVRIPLCTAFWSPARALNSVPLSMARAAGTSHF